MITIIPALINTRKSEYLLNKTLSKIPNNSGLILITQQKKPNIRSLSHLQLLDWSHFNQPIGKWGAIKQGQDILRKNKLKSSHVALLDADDPIQYESLSSSYRMCSSMEEDWLIGCRKKILLCAEDQYSNRTRLYLETFTNSLLLLQLMSEDTLLSIQTPDIQSGFYIFKFDIFNSIEMPNKFTYGGELIIFNQLFIKGFKYLNFDIETTQIRESYYSISQIVNDIVQLNFFKDINCELIARTVKLTPILYKRYFHTYDYTSFKKEIKLILKAMGYGNCII